MTCYRQIFKYDVIMITFDALQMQRDADLIQQWKLYLNYEQIFSTAFIQKQCFSHFAIISFPEQVRG